MATRRVSWALGLVLGALAGGAALAGGVFAALLIGPAIVWAASERWRPVGLGGLITGMGAGAAGLLLLANARCAATNVATPDLVSECVGPDLTPYLVGAAILVATGLAVSLAARTRPASRAA